MVNTMEVLSLVLKYILLLNICPITLAARPHVITIQDYRHTYNPSFFKLMTIQLKNFTDHKALNGSVIFSQNIREASVTYTASAITGKGKPWTLINMTTDACKMLEVGYRKELYLPYMILMDMKASSPYFPTKCPVKKNRELAFIDFHVDAEKYPLKLPEILIKGSLILDVKKINMFHGTVTLSISPPIKKKTG